LVEHLSGLQKVLRSFLSLLAIFWRFIDFEITHFVTISYLRITLKATLGLQGLSRIPETKIRKIIKKIGVSKNGHKERQKNQKLETCDKYRINGGFNVSAYFEDVIITEGHFLHKTWVHSKSVNATSQEENLSLSLLAFWFSHLELNDAAEEALNKLESQSLRSSSSFSGMFWASKWKTVDA